MISSFMRQLPHAGRFAAWVSVRTMAGHSKWHNIKHAKAAADAQKAQVIHKAFKSVHTTDMVVVWLCMRSYFPCSET